MTQSKHTPAPLDWYIAAPDTIRGQEPRIRDTMPAVRDNNTGKEICILTNYSNDHAALIAAAPDLFEALESLIEATYKFNKGICFDHENILNGAESAIAKARWQE